MPKKKKQIKPGTKGKIDNLSLGPLNGAPVKVLKRMSGGLWCCQLDGSREHIALYPNEVDNGNESI